MTTPTKLVIDRLFGERVEWGKFIGSHIGVSPTLLWPKQIHDSYMYSDIIRFADNAQTYSSQAEREMKIEEIGKAIQHTIDKIEKVQMENFMENVTGNAYSVGDHVYFTVRGETIGYRVVRVSHPAFLGHSERSPRYFLEVIHPHHCCPSSIIFDKIGIGTKTNEHFRWCENIVGYDNLTVSGNKHPNVFPKTRSLKDLTFIINKIRLRVLEVNEEHTRKEHRRKKYGLCMEDMYVGKTVYSGSIRYKVIEVGTDTVTIQATDRSHKAKIRPEFLTPEDFAGSKVATDRARDYVESIIQQKRERSTMHHPTSTDELYVGQEVYFGEKLFTIRSLNEEDNTVCIERNIPGGSERGMVKPNELYIPQEQTNTANDMSKFQIGQTVYLYGKYSGRIVTINGMTNLIKVIPDERFNFTCVWNPNDVTFVPVPQYDFSDLKTVQELHHKLWAWLEANPSQEKKDWPKWKFNGGDVPEVKNYCFYCEYAAHHTTDKRKEKCYNCPGNWTNDDKDKPVQCLKGAFGIWADTGRRDTNVRTKAAKLIKNA